jgi:Putative amidase domain
MASAAVTAAGAFTDAASAATTSPGAHTPPVAAARTSGTRASAAPADSRGGAVAWALASVNGACNAFSDDGTDFVSRALAQDGYPFSCTPPVIRTGRINDHHWYYFTEEFGRPYSHSWNVAPDLYVRLADTKAQRITNPKNAQPGDVIFAHWKGTSSAGISHVGIITRMSDGIPLITQHSPSQKNVSLTYWLKYGGPNVHVWIYQP